MSTPHSGYFDETTGAVKWADVSYDAFALCLSFADVATDILVALEFYNRGRMVYFYISISIFAVAQCAYSFAFAYNYGENEPCLFMLHCLLVLMTSPFQSILFLLVKRSKRIRKLLDSKLGFRIERSYYYGAGSDAANSEAAESSAAEFFKQKTMAHLGFILEALFEAFPQSILQLIAIVTLHKSSMLSACSILLSMASVCSKTLIFAHSSHSATFAFFWLCFVADGFAAFATVSWISLDSNSPIAYLWLAKLLIGSMPIAVHLCLQLQKDLNEGWQFFSHYCAWYKECIFDEPQSNTCHYLLSILAFPCVLTCGMRYIL